MTMLVHWPGVVFTLVYCQHPWHRRSVATTTTGHVLSGWAKGQAR